MDNSSPFIFFLLLLLSSFSFSYFLRKNSLNTDAFVKLMGLGFLSLFFLSQSRRLEHIMAAYLMIIRRSFVESTIEVISDGRLK